MQERERERERDVTRSDGDAAVSRRLQRTPIMSAPAAEFSRHNQHQQLSPSELRHLNIRISHTSSCCSLFTTRQTTTHLLSFSFIVILMRKQLGFQLFYVSLLRSQDWFYDFMDFVLYYRAWFYHCQ